MNASPQHPATRDGLMVRVMHRFALAFAEHAIIKGGMALRLLDSPRSTTDIDYVFVPYKSKKDIVSRVRDILGEIEEADVKVTLHSTMLRADIRTDSAAIQIEASVDLACDSIPVATGGFAREQGLPSQIVRILRPDTALAHKLAAWNERRLARDLYDCYFLASRLGEKPNLPLCSANASARSGRGSPSCDGGESCPRPNSPGSFAEKRRISHRNTWPMSSVVCCLRRRWRESPYGSNQPSTASPSRSRPPSRDSASAVVKIDD